MLKLLHPIKMILNLHLAIHLDFYYKTYILIKYQRTIKYYTLCFYHHLEIKVKDIKASPPKYVLKNIFQWANL
jgi:hypothetical protein